ncbi:MAG: LCP family protein [Solirubrobacterales bacterium]|nr:LCP family protein [Solirubrobacterales bacterium]
MPQPSPPQYTVYRARRGLLGRRQGGDGGVPAPKPRRRGLGERGLTPGRIVKWLLLAVAAWLTLSLVVLLVSAQIQAFQVGGDVGDAVGGGAFPPIGATTILVLGSDQRSDDTAEPGSTTEGPSRADTIMLLRVGGGQNQRLSIARDTRVDIPGRGSQRINAALAIGGPTLAVRTVEDYLGIDVNHVMLAGFDDFPPLIDAMGGLTYEGACVVGRVNGGYANGGVTVRVPAGEPTQLNGEQALALARTRDNECRPNESDLSRARRQQKIIGAIKDGMFSPKAFPRLPLIAWQGPRAVRSDMSGPTLLGTFAGLAVTTSPEPDVLGSADGNVPEAARSAAVDRLLGR